VGYTISTMGADDPKTIDETKITEESPQQPEAKSVAPTSALSGIKRTLSEKELEGKGAQKLILDRNDQLEKEVIRLNEYKEKYHAKDKESGVLSERLAQINGSINSRNLLFLLGGIMVGYLPNLWNNKGLFWPVLILGVLFILGGFVNIGFLISQMKGRNK